MSYGMTNPLESIIRDWGESLPVRIAVCRIFSADCEDQVRRGGNFSRSELLLAQTYRHSGRRMAWYAGRCAAKSALDLLAPAHAEKKQWELLRDNQGAPLLSGGHCMYVSITHSGPWAVAAAAPFSVGIDLERDEYRPPALLRYFFTPREQEWACRGAMTERVNRLWTRKEAVVKLLGCGGRLPFSGLDVLKGNRSWRCRTGVANGWVLSVVWGLTDG